MTHDNVLERLDEWVGGELPAPERAEVDLHLAGCTGCRAEAEALRTLLAEVAALPEEILPRRDLWADIAGRLEPRGETMAADATRGLSRGWRAPRWAMQTAAMMALMVGTSWVTVVWMGRREVEKVVDDITAPITRKPAETALVTFQRTEPEYHTAIEELQTVLQTKRAQLAPETVRTLEANLRIIDEAIRQSRAALAADPNSPEVARMLSEAYDQKLNVLQQAVQL
jgi:anti-sigma factor RsiW